MVGNKDGYYDEWYDENKNELLDKRRGKYASDPDYAQKCREAAKEYRRRKKSGEISPSKRKQRSTTVVVGGRSLNAWTISKLAEKVGRSVPTINHWSKHGLMPETPIKAAGGNRLYTDEMITVVKRAIQRRGEVSKKDTTFKKEILEGWEKVGVFIT